MATSACSRPIKARSACRRSATQPLAAAAAHPPPPAALQARGSPARCSTRANPSRARWSLAARCSRGRRSEWCAGCRWLAAAQALPLPFRRPSARPPPTAAPPAAPPAAGAAAGRRGSGARVSALCLAHRAPPPGLQWGATPVPLVCAALAGPCLFSCCMAWPGPLVSLPRWALRGGLTPLYLRDMTLARFPLHLRWS